MITRFAPSPTGPLHLGHAYSAMRAFDLAKSSGGTFLLRIEDIDRSRARKTWEQQIFDDLKWLGLSWPEPVMRQSERLPIYQSKLDQLLDRGLLYPCSCNRRDILEAVSAPQEGAPVGPDGIIYPGTCKGNQNKTITANDVLRLDMDKASQEVSYWQAEPDAKKHTHLPETLVRSIGDIVLARRDMGTSYHLSVVVDDYEQGITDVVRGEDLMSATPIHVLLQKLLGYPTPKYHHHRLIRDENGKRLAKRDDSKALAKFRSEGAKPNGIRALVGLPQVSDQD